MSTSVCRRPALRRLALAWIGLALGSLAAPSTPSTPSTPSGGEALAAGCLRDSQEAQATLNAVRQRIAQKSRQGASIRGGVAAAPGDWPWATVLVVDIGGSLHPECSGTLIAGRWVLSAAHCALRTGDLAFVGATSAGRGERRRIDGVCRHAGFDYRSKQNDIALFRLDQASSQRSLALVGSSDGLGKVGQKATVIGFGATDKDFQAGTLHQAEIPVIDPAVCQKHHSNAITGAMLCAGSNQRTVCGGDSGGSLMARAGSDGWKAVGVTSFGGYCSATLYPAVFTRVLAYRSWIEGVMSSAAALR